MSHGVVKSSNDSRNYKYLVLENGLRVLLINDPEIIIPANTGSERDDGSDDTSHDSAASESEEEEDEASDDGEKADAISKRAAAALAVGIGSFSDPDDLQGLSHYLEHMLFMGSEKFPDENEYDSYLSKHGGSSNAFTEMEYTAYHFDVKPDKLHGALDRFAQFFINPLCKADALEREVQAVDNEFTGVQQSDSCRLAQLRSHTAQKGHLYQKFSWGNRKSLVEQPSAAGIDVRKRLFSYYKANYSAERMTLAVLGGNSLEDLETWVREMFSPVPGGRGQMPSFRGLANPYQGSSVCLLPAVKQVHHLEVSFQLPSLTARYLAKAEDYLSCLIGHESSGSLLSLLKAKGWATGLSAGVGLGGFERNTGIYLFDVSITLTKAGMAAAPGLGLAVLGPLFEYLAMLLQRGPQEWFYRELADVGDMKARFLEQEDAAEYVSELSSSLLYVQPQHLLLHDYLYKDWDPALVKRLLAEMRPDAVQVYVQTSEYEGQRSNPILAAATEKIEPWFQMPYVGSRVPAELLAQWNRAISTPSQELQLPPKNAFIPTDFSIRSSEAGSEETASPMTKRSRTGEELQNGNGSAKTQPPTSLQTPSQAIEKEGLRLWHILDNIFRTPKSAAYFMIAAPVAYSSPRASAATQLLLDLLQDSLNETTYLADVAGLEYSIWADGKNGIVLRISGFSHKLPSLAQAILEHFAAYKVSEDNFGRVKETLMRRFQNANLKVDYQATNLRLRCLKQIWPAEDKLLALAELQPQTTQAFLVQLLEVLHVEVLLEGNHSTDEARNLADLAVKALGSRPLPISGRPIQDMAELPEGCSYLLRQPAKNKEEANSAVEIYLQCGQDSLQLRIALDLIACILFEPFFNSLRTQQQLGYSLNCGIRLTQNILGFAFTIHSGSHAPAYLEARVEAFLSEFHAELTRLSDEEFEAHKESLISVKQQKDHSIEDQAQRHWEEVANRRYNFKCREQEVKALRNVEKTEVVEVYEKYLLPASAHRRHLAVHVFGKSCVQHIQDQPSQHTIAIESPEALRTNLEQVTK